MKTMLGCVIAVIGTATGSMLSTACGAPPLSRTETAGHPRNLPDGVECCPEDGGTGVQRSRKRVEATDIVPTICLRCINGEPVLPSTSTPSSATAAPAPPRQ